MGADSKRKFTISLDKGRGIAEALDTVEGEEAAINAYRKRIENATSSMHFSIWQDNNDRHRRDLEAKAEGWVDPDDADTPNMSEDLLSYLKELREVLPQDQEISNDQLKLLSEKFTEYLSQATSSEQFRAMARRFSNEFMYCDEFSECEDIDNFEWYYSRLNYIYEIALWIRI